MGRPKSDSAIYTHRQLLSEEDNKVNHFSQEYSELSSIPTPNTNSDSEIQSSVTDIQSVVTDRDDENKDQENIQEALEREENKDEENAEEYFNQINLSIDTFSHLLIDCFREIHDGNILVSSTSTEEYNKALLEKLSLILTDGLLIDVINFIAIHLDRIPDLQVVSTLSHHQDINGALTGDDNLKTINNIDPSVLIKLLKFKLTSKPHVIATEIRRAIARVFQLYVGYDDIGKMEAGEYFSLFDQFFGPSDHGEISVLSIFFDLIEYVDSLLDNIDRVDENVQYGLQQIIPMDEQYDELHYNVISKLYRKFRNLPQIQRNYNLKKALLFVKSYLTKVLEHSPKDLKRIGNLEEDLVPSPDEIERNLLYYENQREERNNRQGAHMTLFQHQMMAASLTTILVLIFGLIGHSMENPAVFNGFIQIVFPPAFIAIYLLFFGTSYSE